MDAEFDILDTQLLPSGFESRLSHFRQYLAHSEFNHQGIQGDEINDMISPSSSVSPLQGSSLISDSSLLRDAMI
ncbi:hypothetical protein NQZ68_029420, partial [Dissostichus eleginoides]